MILRTIALLLLCTFGNGCSGCMENYSNGERTGYVLKFSKKGLTDSTKSWEGELRLLVPGAATATTDSTTWAFSVEDEATAQAVQKAQESGKRVSLTYRQYAIKPTWINTDYVVVGVRAVDEQ